MKHLEVLDSGVLMAGAESALADVTLGLFLVCCSRNLGF